jgi:preprotein translocase subunit SecE
MTTATTNEDGNSVANIAKLAAAVLVLAAGIYGFYALGDSSKALRVVGLVVALLASIGIAAMTAQGRMARGYLIESQFELRKVVWPTRQEATQTTLVILLVVLIISVILWLIDMLLGWAILEHLLKSAG